jgi:hypothetical protein
MPDPDNESRLRLLEAGLVRLETTVHLFVEESRATRAELVPRLQSLLEARSGERAEAQTLQRDVDRAHEKIRSIDARQDRMEARQSKHHWIVVGAVTVLQALAALVIWLIEHRDLFGGS